MILIWHHVIQVTNQKPFSSRIEVDVRIRTISSDPHLWSTLSATLNFARPCLISSLFPSCQLSLIAADHSGNRLLADRYGHLADEYQLNL